MTLSEQAIYNTKDVAKLFDIHPSTVRKYCDFLEKEGYFFHKNDFGHRGFFDDDLIALRKLIELKDAMTLEQATKSVIAWKNDSDVVGVATEKEQYIGRYSELLEEFKAFKEEQNAFNQELLKQLNSEREYIKTVLEERDKNLMIAMREPLETQKQLASSSEQPKKRWWEFWK